MYTYKTLIIKKYNFSLFSKKKNNVVNDVEIDNEINNYIKDGWEYVNHSSSFDSLSSCHYHTFIFRKNIEN